VTTARTRTRRSPPADPEPPHVRPSRRAPALRSLRGRATLAFTGLTVVLSCVLAFTVWLTVSQYLLLQRERATLIQATDNAAQVRRALGTEGLAVPQVLAALPRESGSFSLYVEDDEWGTTSLLVGRDDIPAVLVDTVVGGTPARQRINVQDTTMMAVGIPLAGLDEAYFEVFPLEELDRTYRVLGTVLSLAVVGLVPLTFTVGWWVTRPTLRPLDRNDRRHRQIGEGDLSARIDPGDDPSLVPIASSFNRTAADLEARVRADARFAADVSHELRSPLTTLVTSVEVLGARKEELPPRGREALRLVESELGRFRRTLDDLLQLARLDGAPALDSTTPVSLSALVREVMSRTGLPDSLLHADPDADTLVLGDKTSLERAVRNLLENARRYGGSDVTVVLERKGASADVRVCDRGPGVPAGQEERIFEPFFRMPGHAEREGGVGLGLALVKQIAERHGGSARCEPRDGGGSCFVITLPA